MQEQEQIKDKRSRSFPRAKADETQFPACVDIKTVHRIETGDCYMFLKSIGHGDFIRKGTRSDLEKHTLAEHSLPSGTKRHIIVEASNHRFASSNAEELQKIYG